MIRAIIVDDEAPARRELQRMLAQHDDVVVTGAAKDIDAAVGRALRTRPDVVFLDIRLGQASGFELLRELDESIAVVFVTAYDEYAVEAFEDNALDYLLKPVDPLRLANRSSAYGDSCTRGPPASVRPRPHRSAADAGCFSTRRRARSSSRSAASRASTRRAAAAAFARRLALRFSLRARSKSGLAGCHLIFGACTARRLSISPTSSTWSRGPITATGSTCAATKSLCV